MQSRWLAIVALACACSCSEDGSQGKAFDPTLDCDPSDSWLVLTAASAGVPALENLGDADCAAPDEVGDGVHHLFVGVAHTEITDANSWGAVLIHDATSKDASGPYVLSPTPIVSQRDAYDRYGIEVPAYLRIDARTEYIYYCALYASYEPAAKGQIAALKRVDGGAWQKLGPVAAFGPGSSSQCEPEAVLDPATGNVLLFLIADGDLPGMKLRASKDPEHFVAEGEAPLGQYTTRIALSHDPIGDVWRSALDIGGYPHPLWTAQSWTRALPPDDTTLQQNGEMLHQGTHDLHPELHANGAFVSQSAGAFYPSSGEVVFFYTAEIDAAASMRVAAQRCRRR